MIESLYSRYNPLHKTNKVATDLNASANPYQKWPANSEKNVRASRNFSHFKSHMRRVLKQPG